MLPGPSSWFSTTFPSTSPDRQGLRLEESELSPTSATLIASTLGVIGTLLGAVAGASFQFLQADRNRQWQKEDSNRNRRWQKEDLLNDAKRVVYAEYVRA